MGSNENIYKTIIDGDHYLIRHVQIRKGRGSYWKVIKNNKRERGFLTLAAAKRWLNKVEKANYDIMKIKESL